MQDPHNTPSAAVNTSLEPTFFGKVMTFFALAVFASTAGVFITTKYFLFQFLVYPWLMYVFFVAELGLIFTSRIWSKKIPLNRILFVAFAFLTGITAAPLIGVVLASPGGAALVGKALLAATFMFTATAIIGWTTKRDLSGMRGFLLMSLLGLIIVGVINIFVPWGSTGEMIYSGIGIIIFAGFTMYDFQRIKRYPADEYINAALALYLDIFNMFLLILRFMMASRD